MKNSYFNFADTFAHRNHPEEDILIDTPNVSDSIIGDALKKRVTPGHMEDMIQWKKQKKKNTKAASLLFFLIGLVISLSIVILGFEWKSFDSAGVKDLGQVAEDFDQIFEIPPTQQPPPPPPQQKVQYLNIVEVVDDEVIEEVEIELDIEITEDMVIEDVQYQATVAEEPEEEVAEEIFTIVEEWPTFPGGDAAFYAYLKENLNYPTLAKRNGIQGIVFVRFVVEKDGSITQAQAIRGIGGGCDEEAVEVIKQSPKWNIGKQRGRPVRVAMTVPIRFIMSN